jgi:hypothetical protein
VITAPISAYRWLLLSLVSGASFSGSRERRRTHDAADFVARTAVEHLLEHLLASGVVPMKKLGRALSRAAS